MFVLEIRSTATHGSINYSGHFQTERIADPFGRAERLLRLRGRAAGGRDVQRQVVGGRVHRAAAELMSNGRADVGPAGGPAQGLLDGGDAGVFAELIGHERVDDEAATELFVACSPRHVTPRHVTGS